MCTCNRLSGGKVDRDRIFKREKPRPNRRDVRGRRTSKADENSFLYIQQIGFTIKCDRNRDENVITGKESVLMESVNERDSLKLYLDG